MGQARAGALLPGGETHGGSAGLLAILKSIPDRPGGKRGWACASNLKDSHAAPPQWPCWVPSRPHLNRLAYDSRGRLSGLCGQPGMLGGRCPPLSVQSCGSKDPG